MTIPAAGPCGNPLAKGSLGRYPTRPPQGFAELFPVFMKLAKLLSADQIILDMKSEGHWTAITEHLTAAEPARAPETTE